jgi:hypothetical protein
MIKWSKIQMAAMVIIAIVMIGAPVMFGIWMLSPGSASPAHLDAPTAVSAVPMPQLPGIRVTFPTPSLAESQAVPAADPSLAKFPYAPGWPMALPGQITGTPVVADLLGDGKLEVVVPCMYRNKSINMRHPRPNPTPLLFAFHADGAPLDGWPVAIGGPRRPGNGLSWGGWSSSPSVFRRDGKDVLVLMAPGRGVSVLGADRQITNFAGGNSTVNVPLADLGNGVMDITIGGVARTVDGGPIPSWPMSRKFHDGYAPCIGSAKGDGSLQLFHLFYTDPGTPYADVVGFDSSGNRLPGWPRKIDDPSWLAPVMGDVLGDGKMDVIGAYGGHIFAWTWDGNGLPNTTSEGPMTGILKSNLFAATACPALADLDGSGKACIIVFDMQTDTLRAWHGNGVGVGDEQKAEPTTQQAVHKMVAGWFGVPGNDGILARVPGMNHGVSVASLGDDPRVMDFFTGTHWIRRFPNGKTTVTNMLPADAQIEWTQPTIADVERNGMADVIFGLSDGRVFVYRTNLAYHADRMQWPTANGNFQHTGAWKPAPVSAAGAQNGANPRQIAQAADIPPPLPSPASLLANEDKGGLQFRLIATPGDNADADEMINPSTHEIVRVLKTVELDEHDLVRAYPLEAGGEIQVGIDFTPLGSAKLAVVTSANIGHPLAIVFNDTLLSMPTIRTKLSSSAAINGGGANGFTAQQVQSLVDAINARIAAAAR